MKTVKKIFTSEHYGEYTIELQNITEKVLKGDIMVTDPLNYLSKEMWQNLVDLFNSDKDFINNGLAIITTQKRVCEILYTKTERGNGLYPIYVYYDDGTYQSPTVNTKSGIISFVYENDAKYLYVREEHDYDFFEKQYCPHISNYKGLIKFKGYNVVGDIYIFTGYEKDNGIW